MAEREDTLRKEVARNRSGGSFVDLTAGNCYDRLLYYWEKST
jgi:hypothetical protein